MNLNQVTLPTHDMQRSTRFYRHMGFLQIVDSPRYARFECPEGDSTFSLSLQDKGTEPSAIIYFEHEQLDEWVHELVATHMCLVMVFLNQQAN